MSTMSEPLSTLTLCVLAGTIGFIWGLSELIGAFKNETGRALRTGGAWLLLVVNWAAAAGSFFLIASLIDSANNWLTAIFMGFAWPTILRNASFKLAQPLQSSKSENVAVIRFEEAYATVQNLCRQLINNTLTRQRMRLVTNATEQELGELEKYARLALIASPLQNEQGVPADAFIDKIMQRDVQDELKKALLASFVMSSFGRATLEDFLRTQRRR